MSKKKSCKYCGKEIEYFHKEPKTCGSRECQLKYQKENYDFHRIKCLCKKCGVEYMAAPQQSKELCCNCARHEKTSESFRTFEQKIICRQCGKLIGVQTKKITHKIVKEIKSKTCDECKKRNYQQNAQKYLILKKFNFKNMEEYQIFKNQQEFNLKIEKLLKILKKILKQKQKEELDSFNFKIPKNAKIKLIKNLKIKPIKNPKIKIFQIKLPIISKYDLWKQDLDVDNFKIDYEYNLFTVPELAEKYCTSQDFIYKLIKDLNLIRHINADNYSKAKNYRKGTYVIDEGFDFQGFHWAPRKEDKFNLKATITFERNKIKKQQEIASKKDLKGAYLAENIRSFLGFWRKENLERSNYSCELCGAKGIPLQVHHKEPYRNIYYKCCAQVGVAPKNLINKSKEYYEVKNLVLNYHRENKSLGLVVCKECHKQIDEIYKILQKEK